MMIGIVDYDMGNLRSIENALNFLGVRHSLIRDPAQVSGADKLILPGVGTFQKAMANLQESGLAAAVTAAARAGTPLLGICLGMQLLADEGEEGGLSAGLGLIRGTVKRLNPGAGLPIPHMGFNEVEFVLDSPLLEGIASRSHFYFAHSYHLACPQDIVVGIAVHGAIFTAVVASGNVFGAQFHPEKSQSHGLRLLQNFCGNQLC